MQTQLVGLLAGALVMFSVGLIDDIVGDRLPVGLKFAGQCVAAAIPVACGIHVEFTGIAALNVMLSFLWILGISNAFNLLDNMDGACRRRGGELSVHLFPERGRARRDLPLFDSRGFRGRARRLPAIQSPPGKSVHGGWWSTLYRLYAVLAHNPRALRESGLVHALSVLMPAFVLAVPLIDTLSVIAIRVHEGRPIYHGDRCHLSHRLVDSGLAEPQAVKLLFLLTLALGMGALNLAHASIGRSLWTLTYTAAAAVLVLSGMRVNTLFNGGRVASARRSSKPAEGL